jgi:LacI family transcriptional regulator
LRITIHDVARAAGVSVTAVSRALNNKGELSPEKRARVLAAAEQLGYVPSGVARALVSGQTKTLGVLVTDNTSPVYAEILRGIEEAALGAGFSLLFGNSADSQEQALRWLDLVHAKHVDGLLLTPVQTDRRDIERLGAWGIPFVMLLRYFVDVPCDYVVTDNVLAGYLATRHLVETGHRRIGHVGGPPWTSSGRDRFLGYQRALLERSIPLDADLVACDSFTIGGGARATEALLRQPNRPTAIFASTDLQAVGVLKCARSFGLRVPEDLALVGGDDIELAEFLEVPLTTFHYPARDIGRIGAELLIARIQDGMNQVDLERNDRFKRIVVDPKLIVRRSCGCSD